MTVTLASKDDRYVLNWCAKYLARDNQDERSNFGQFPAGDARGRIAESWRFPVIDGYGEGPDPAENYRYNTVTFIYRRFDGAPPASVQVVGTFGDLYAPVALRRVPDTGYFTISAKVPKGQVHLYRYIVDGEMTPDPINPQRVTTEGGRVWSRFFTQLTVQPVALERRELALLQRLTEEVLPFRTELGERAFRSLSGPAAGAYHLDHSVGAANFIDKVLAREESHNFVHYRICLDLLGRVLAARYPGTLPEDAPREGLQQLLGEMSSGQVGGWDYGRYGDPAFFLRLLRRHTVTGTFCHPKYGGNIGALGWAYLGERYHDKNGTTLFDWRKVMEWPLGDNRDYLGVPAGSTRV
jgi:hypothetical protein